MIRMKRIKAGHYTARGYEAKRMPNGVWTLTFPDGGRDGCETLSHARATIACYEGV